MSRIPNKIVTSRDNDPFWQLPQVLNTGNKYLELYCTNMIHS